MTDRELLELAAKAAGIKHNGYFDLDGLYVEVRQGGHYDKWNPLTDDGDALRLAVVIDAEILITQHACIVTLEKWRGINAIRIQENHFSTETKRQDPYAATRRAIVRAAAEIGRMMG